MSAPPTSVVAKTRRLRPSLAIVSWIWMASSLVGARIKPRGWLSVVPASRSIIGITKAAVLPVPVCAHPSTSRPASPGGMAWAWMGVGSVNPALAMSRKMASDKPRLLKLL